MENATPVAPVERLVRHLRGLADALEELSASPAVATSEPTPLDDMIPWNTYPARLQKAVPYLRSAWHPAYREKRDFGCPRTFREALAVGRSVFRGIRNCGEITLKPLDDDFISRSCLEWLSS